MISKNPKKEAEDFILIPEEGLGMEGTPEKVRKVPSELRDYHFAIPGIPLRPEGKGMYRVRLG